MRFSINVIFLTFKINLSFQPNSSEFFSIFSKPLLLTEEGFEHDAFVSYPISTSTSTEERQLLLEMLSKTRKVMAELGYEKTYDPNNEDKGQRE